MKPKFLPVLEMCIESGVRLGINRAYKHDDNPTPDTIIENINREILNQLYEWFDFEEIEK